MDLIIMWIISALAVMGTAYLVPGAEAPLVPALLAAAALGFANAFLRPLLILLTLPINIMTLGLFTFVLNALLIMLVSMVVPGFVVGGFFGALLFGVVLAIIQSFLFMLLGPRR